ncbi:hypothetical protein O3P69_003913 [Scylla paramamosain]|uniref:Uncharacterized protein n=1 Tax=Scylla paramamosain TaxID=85552 RepID=A0AAW0UFI1_SCYPA
MFVCLFLDAYNGHQMNQEWTYRPPVLVGERIVWLGGDTTPEPGEPCNYHPHHGTVSWIGRVSEIGNDWIVGVEFELDMAGGCDGTWKGRKLFSCPKMRGLFLPVASVIKEKEFYSKKDCLPSNTTSVTAPVSSNTSQSQTNIDLSLAPEPPPPKNKMPLHSPSIIHSRNAKKQNEDDLKVSPRCAVENGGEKTSHHHMHKSMGATSMASCVPSPSTGATVITSTQCSTTDISTYTKLKEELHCHQAMFPQATAVKKNLADHYQKKVVNLQLPLALKILIAHSEATEVPDVITEHMNNDGCRNVSDNSTSVAPETRTDPQVWPQLEQKDVDRLSHQLTEADGIATFKANLRVEEPALGQTNTLHIGKLLKRLEAAISRGNHAEAAKLAHELADFRVSCSVTRNNKNTNSSTSAGSSTTQVNLSSNNHEVRQLAPIHSDAESSGMQASSNISECYYDAAEVMEDDELTTDDHDNLLDMACATRREIKVDPARREVKSDTITKLPDGLHVHMKENKESNQPFYVKMYVEDKNSHQGPLSFAVTPTMTVGQLREKGKRLADDDHLTLEHHRVTSEGCPIFLYLVAPELESQANACKKRKGLGQSGYGENSQELGASGGGANDKPRSISLSSKHSTRALQMSSQTNLRKSFHPHPELMVGCVLHVLLSTNGPGLAVRPVPLSGPGTSHQVAGAVDKGSGLGAVVSVLDRQGYVPNPDPFECRVCFMDVDSGKGVVLRDCLHTFCRDCLANAIKYSDTADVKCPYRDNQYSCDSSLQDREIKALLTAKEYEQHLNKSVKQAEGAMQNVFHCKTPDCPGFCQYEDNVNEFHCDVCGKDNCLTCQAQHGGITCQEYQDDLANKVDEAAMKTKKFFDDMIRRGDGLPCPKCSVMLVRKWGCDWMRCPMCRTEICWVTRGPRWGPGGPGDVSGGCKCGIRGQKCHPKCTYCH